MKDFASTKDRMKLAPRGYAGHHSREQGKPGESVSSTDDELEIEPTRQSSNPGLEASQSTPELGPELTDESRRHEKDMEIRHQGETPTCPQPLPTNSRGASVERGSEEAAAVSRALRDISPNLTMESDIGLRPDVLLELEREYLNVTDHSATPPGNSPRLGSLRKSYSSPHNRTPPWMAALRSDAALSDLET